VPWPRGTVHSGQPFALRTVDAEPVPVQSWVTATWPDGSVKWSAHAIAPQARPADGYVLVPGAEPAQPDPAVRITETPDAVTVHTGQVRWVMARHSGVLIRTAIRDGHEIVRNVRLVSLWQDEPTPDCAGTVFRQQYHGAVERLAVEQHGPVRAVVRVDGRNPMPFTIRLYFYAGADDVRILHTFVWDGDPEQQFLAGLGLRADVPMRDELHDRHVRLAGPTGFLTEAVRGITGLRRDPGPRFRAAQVSGRPCGPVREWNEAVSSRRHLIPAWNDWTLDQTSADGFLLRKRTGGDSGWVTIPSASRSAGYGYLGGVSGGLGFGLRDFWQQYPTRLDIRGAATETATATVWLWSPSAPAMDLRFYHDGLGQDSYPEQLEALEVTYEDYEPGFADPRGIARTHELVLRVYPATPETDELAEHTAAMNDPPLLVASPERLHAAGVFGDWSLVDRSDPARAAIEDRLDFLVDFYLGQREQRRWYGFWDYGDVMHTYDADRHQWRYDVGGYAWDNSELSPDLWLWYQFLRTGRADVFRFAEAMTRHTGEVDVYHLGRFTGLGSRHNVQHWGCSAKQLRISSAVYRRIYYYLTADERTGELLSELADAERTFAVVDPLRKLRRQPYSPNHRQVAVGLGTDWGALAAAWLTEWERTGREAVRNKLLGTMRDIGSRPNGFLTGEAVLDLSTGRFDPSRETTDRAAKAAKTISVSHLSAVFGLVEVCSELIALTRGTDLAVPEFERAWLSYCRLYLATPEEQAAAIGRPLTGISLVQAHSRLSAYAAAHLGDEQLARRAWQAFRQDQGDQLNVNPLQREPCWRTTRVDGTGVLVPVTEAPYVSTNDAAQYGLAAIQNLALIGGWLSDERPDPVP
jgi:hypothetical protein